MPSIAEEPEVLESEVEQEQRTMPDFVKPLADLEMIEGKEAVLKCKVAGLPYPTIAWYHNGKMIHSTDDRKMTQRKEAISLYFSLSLSLFLSLSLSLSLPPSLIPPNYLPLSLIHLSLHQA